jgi:arginyl-tRNA synthetase
LRARDAIGQAISSALEGLGWSDAGVPVVLERPREAAHGDISSPIAMGLARVLRQNPMRIAEKVAGKLDVARDVVASVEVLKPGFINFRFSDVVLTANLLDILAEKDRFGSSDVGSGERCQVEYVSANPTGPLVIVSARAAAVGSVIVNLLNFAGFEAEGEYYVNDYGGQVGALGKSLEYRIRERFGKLAPGEEIGAYPGEYLKEIATALSESEATTVLAEGRATEVAVETILGGILDDLNEFGVEFNNVFRESTLHPEAVERAIETVRERGHTYEKDGALYFRTIDFGDDKDRVLRKSDGAPTYFSADIAYHHDKFRRGFRRAIGLLGPDHHGHVPRMRAAMSVLGAPEDWLEIMIVGWVRLMEAGKPVGMSKRAGEFITMRELINDVGSDVAKYFFLMRRANSPLDFDLTLARKQSDENPVFYVQYAHARISSVTRFAREKHLSSEAAEVDLSQLTDKTERELMLHLLYFPLVVEGSAMSREPHRLTTYAQELAAAFHQFYHECRIVSDNEELSSARLVLAEATMQVLKNALTLLGVGAPSSM